MFTTSTSNTSVRKTLGEGQEKRLKMLFPYIQPDMVGVVKGVHVIFSLTPTHNGELSSAH